MEEKIELPVLFDGGAGDFLAGDDPLGSQEVVSLPLSHARRRRLQVDRQLLPDLLLRVQLLVRRSRLVALDEHLQQTRYSVQLIHFYTAAQSERALSIALQMGRDVIKETSRLDAVPAATLGGTQLLSMVHAITFFKSHMAA